MVDYIRHVITLIVCFKVISIVMAGDYVMIEYYMDPSQSDAFGGACENYIQDSALFLNSHVNPFNIVNYGDNKHCWVVLDAGTMAGATYRMVFKKFELEDSAADGSCPSDYMALYNGPEENTTTHISTHCGKELPHVDWNAVNQRYLTVVFHSNNQETFKGFQLLAIRTEPPPCQDDEFLCPYEERCITKRVHCDGTEHCLDGADEFDCTALEVFVGTFLSLGLGGIIAVAVAVVSGVIVILAICCCAKCCKRSDGRLAEVRLSLSGRRSRCGPDVVSDGRDGRNTGDGRRR